MMSMANLKLPGEFAAKRGHKTTFHEKIITFKKIAGLIKDKRLLTPPFQGALDEDKVDQMIYSFKKNRDYLYFKNKIVIGVIPPKTIDYLEPDNYKMYVLDGQHRVEMARRLAEEGENDDLWFCYYETRDNREMKKLFEEINKDSMKNSKYISLNEFNQTIYDEVKDYFMKERAVDFSQKKKINNKLYTINEFIDILVDKKYMENLSSKKIIQQIENKNNIFYNSIDYKEYDPNCFYEDEKRPIDNKYICSLKNNNFIDFLVDTNNKVIPDHHTFKKMKEFLSPRLRIIVWTLSYGECTEGPCPLCNTLINSGKNGFHCGHIISEANGGESIPRNLRPICASCNSKMGSTNWDVYEKSKKMK